MPSLFLRAAQSRNYAHSPFLELSDGILMGFKVAAKDSTPELVAEADRKKALAVGEET